MYKLLFVICNLFGILGIWLLEFAAPVAAQCPVCIVTVGGGMLLAKKLGIDDLLVSIWISALNVALSFWLAPKLKIRLLRNGHFLTLFLFASTLFYFRLTDQIGGSGNRLFGFDKIIFGQIIGLVVMTLANHGYLFLKSRLGHTPFPYAKVAFPVGLLTLITLIFKFTFNL